jgi:hypothetical protein
MGTKERTRLSRSAAAAAPCTRRRAQRSLRPANRAQSRSPSAPRTAATRRTTVANLRDRVRTTATSRATSCTPGWCDRSFAAQPPPSAACALTAFMRLLVQELAIREQDKSEAHGNDLEIRLRELERLQVQRPPLPDIGIGRLLRQLCLRIRSITPSTTSCVRRLDWCAFLPCDDGVRLGRLCKPRARSEPRLWPAPSAARAARPTWTRLERGALWTPPCLSDLVKRKCVRRRARDLSADAHRRNRGTVSH